MPGRNKEFGEARTSYRNSREKNISQTKTGDENTEITQSATVNTFLPLALEPNRLTSQFENIGFCPKMRWRARAESIPPVTPARYPLCSWISIGSFYRWPKRNCGPGPVIALANRPVTGCNVSHNFLNAVRPLNIEVNGIR